VAVRIGHVKIAFSPGGVAWDFRIKSTFLQMSPESVHIRNVEDQPPPASRCFTDCRLCVSCVQRREPRAFSTVRSSMPKTSL